MCVQNGATKICMSIVWPGKLKASITMCFEMEVIFLPLPYPLSNEILHDLTGGSHD